MSDFTARSQPSEPGAPRVPPLVDRITEILREQFPLNGNDVHAHVADLIAAAAQEHYRPVIDTVEQLDALVEDTVILDACGAAGRKVLEVWWWTGTSDPFEPALPVIVVWSPGAGE